MKFDTSHLETLTAAIARSPITVQDSAFVRDNALAHLPAGFEKMDVAILRWIAADSRRAGHGRTLN
jgi:hypothetical protein